MQSSNVVEYFLHAADKSEQQIVDWCDYRIGYFYSKNKNKSSQNEDTLFVYGKEGHLVFGVSDGAGGHPKGEEAAFIVGNEVLDFYKQPQRSKLKILELIEGINDKVIDLKVGAYSTLAMVTISEDFLRSFSVGDSEIIYWNGVGKELYSNIPQSEVGYRIEAGDLLQGESLDDPERYTVNNLIGDPSFRIEVASKMKMKKGHTILVGSDGLFDNITHEELTEIVGKGAFDKSFEDLCELCLQQDEQIWKKDDDISIVLVRKIKS